MPKIVYDTTGGYDEVRVDELKYREDIDCWWYYTENEDATEGGNRARYVPRERVFYVERGE